MVINNEKWWCALNQLWCVSYDKGTWRSNGSFTGKKIAFAFAPFRFNSDSNIEVITFNYGEVANPPNMSIKGPGDAGKSDHSKFIPSRPLTRSQAKKLHDAHLVLKNELTEVETRKSSEKAVIVMACKAEDMPVKRPVPGDNTIWDMLVSDIQHRGHALPGAS